MILELLQATSLKQNIEFFLQVDNLFDTKRHYGIYVDTGLADESTELQRYLDAGTVPDIEFYGMVH